jgi:hypothetical protein
MNQSDLSNGFGESSARGGTVALPLDIAMPGDSLSERRQRQLLWALLAIGVLARAVRYFLRFPLWDDECFLLANLLDRGYADLTEPLNYWQICPIGFLWLELSLTKLLGFSEYVVRLPSFLCGIAGLFLFRHVAGRLLRGTALVLAVGVFAVAYPLIRYSAEAKPYGIDMFLGLVFLAMSVEWWIAVTRAGATAGLSSSAENHYTLGAHTAGQASSGTLRSFDGVAGATTDATGETPMAPSRWLWALAALAPVAVFSSYPIVFVAGGTSLFVAYVLWRRRERRGWVAWVVYNVALLAAFAVVFVVSIEPQSEAALRSMREYWERGFPPLAHPLGMIAWFFKAHTGQLLAYPFGGDNAGSTLTFILCVVALISIVRRRQYTLLLLLLAPLGLTFVAAALGRYPYGGMVRFNIYMAPSICIMAGLGLAALVVPRRQTLPTQGRTGVVVAAGVLAAVAVGTMVRDVARPAKTAVDMRYRDFARWFWFDMAQDGELVCLKSDLGKSFSPEFQHGYSAMYLCNQRIYSPRHARNEKPRWERISAEWPLRCAQFKSSVYEYDDAGFARWLAEMKEKYSLVGRQDYPLLCYDRFGKTIRAKTWVELYTFVPKKNHAATAQGTSANKRR